jgi:hypothetical protein
VELMMKSWYCGVALAMVALPCLGQGTSISLEQLPCLPASEHAVVRAQVANQQAGTEVRVYFRRLHHVVEDFYWIEMEPEGGGRYWAALPMPAPELAKRFDLEERLRKSAEQENHPWGAWWKSKESSDDRNPNGDLPAEEIRERASVGRQTNRGWMESWDLVELEDWLARQKYEPAEYYGAVVDPSGRVLAVSPMRVAPVEDRCPVQLTPQQQGFAHNLVIGETAPWQQRGERPFHWLCDHVVTRVNYQNILRADEVCRACVVAWWKKKEFLIPLAAGVGGSIVGVIIDDDDPVVSPSGP